MLLNWSSNLTRHSELHLATLGRGPLCDHSQPSQSQCFESAVGRGPWLLSQVEERTKETGAGREEWLLQTEACFVQTDIEERSFLMGHVTVSHLLHKEAGRITVTTCRAPKGRKPHWGPQMTFHPFFRSKWQPTALGTPVRSSVSVRCGSAGLAVSITGLQEGEWGQWQVRQTGGSLKGGGLEL